MAPTSLLWLLAAGTLLGLALFAAMLVEGV